jgi:hypothetical protein
MGNVSRMRALVFASALTVGAVVSTTPLLACDSANCASRLVVAQAQPAAQSQQAQPEAVGKPISLKRYAKSKSRSARKSRRHTASQRLVRKTTKDAEASQSRKSTPTPAVAPAVADANAELLDGGDRNNAASSDLLKIDTPAAPTEAAPAENAPPSQVMAADEFNDLDRAAWDAAVQTKSTTPALLESRAEMRDDDSKWAQTSTIGKIFVVFGALLTIGSAIRMFLA